MRLALAFAAFLAAGPVSSQQQPDFSGEWLVVPEVSTPAGRLAMGTRARMVVTNSRMRTS